MPRAVWIKVRRGWLIQRWRRNSDDRLFEYDGSRRAKATLVQHCKVPAYSCHGGHVFSACPKHGASPLLWRRPRPPERLHRTIASPLGGSGGCLDQGHDPRKPQVAFTSLHAVAWFALRGCRPGREGRWGEVAACPVAEIQQLVLSSHPTS